MKRLVTIFAAGLVLAAVTVTAPGAAAAPEPECWDASVPIEDASGWTYTHSVHWCGDGESITGVDPVEVGFDPGDSGGFCPWQGVRERHERPAGGPWETFSMGALHCETDGPEILQVNPWVIVTVHGDGQWDEEKGIARSVLVAG